MTPYPLRALMALQRAARALHADENEKTRAAYAGALAALTALDTATETEGTAGLAHPSPNFIRAIPEMQVRAHISLLPGTSLVFTHEAHNTTISLHRPQFTDVLLIQGDVSGTGWEKAIASLSQSGILVDTDTLDDYGRFTLRPMGNSLIEIRLKRADRHIVELPPITLEADDE